METREQLPTTDSDEILRLACLEMNPELRDTAIAQGANASFLLLCSVGHIWGLIRDKNPAETVLLAHDGDYLQIKFLLESKINIKICKTTMKMALAIGPEMLILLFDHLYHHGHWFSENRIETLLKEHVFSYMVSHTINILYEKDYLKAGIRSVCRSVLKLNNFEFCAAIGDEKELAKMLENMKLGDSVYDQLRACWALRDACHFERVNTSKILIEAGTNVNFQTSIPNYVSLFDPGSILYRAVLTKHIDIVSLLLSVKNIDISIKPKNESFAIYDFAMQSDSEGIKQLFQNKKAEISEDINKMILKIVARIHILRNNAQSWFGYGNANKAMNIEKALERAQKCKDDCLSVDGFLNYSQENEVSIANALAYNRIYFWGKTNSSLAVDADVPHDNVMLRK